MRDKESGEGREAKVFPFSRKQRDFPCIFYFNNLEIDLPTKRMLTLNQSSFTIYLLQTKRAECLVVFIFLSLHKNCLPNCIPSWNKQLAQWMPSSPSLPPFNVSKQTRCILLTYPIFCFSHKLYLSNFYLYWQAAI